ncbi:hypothetical protein ACFL1X_03495 [Candidatus Hydrogenedentota bacterium]
MHIKDRQYYHVHRKFKHSPLWKKGALINLTRKVSNNWFGFYDAAKMLPKETKVCYDRDLLMGASALVHYGGLPSRRP